MVEERLTRFDPANRSSAGLHLTVRLVGSLLLRWVRRDVGKVLNERGYRLQNGTAHPRKLAAIIRDSPTVR